MKNKIASTPFALILVALLFVSPHAQPTTATNQSSEDRVALYQALLDLTNPWTVMCIAAHPDDEDGTSLIVMRHKFGAHTVSLFSTFGEGGQNAIGPELYEELGAIRARETMAAAEIQGSEPHFLGLKDFGYSKSADEAFRFWGHDEALRRMVFEIRKLRPDVIITNHSVTSNDHGHHQATARLVVEAFDAAADPKRFPEQLKDGVTTWQVQRLFVRARGNTQAQADNSPVVTIDPNERDPIRGVVYAEEALRALQKHATQGPWPKTFAEFAARFRSFTGQSAAPGQLPLIRYRLVREAKGADAVPKDSHNLLDGLRLPVEVAKQLAPPMIDGRPAIEFIDNRKLLLQQLLNYRTNFQNSYLEYHKQAVSEAVAGERKSTEISRFLLVIQRLERSLALAAGIDFKVVPFIVVTPGYAGTLSFTISNRGSQRVIVYKCDTCAPGGICFDDPPSIVWSVGQAINVRPPKVDVVLSGTKLDATATLRTPDKMPVNNPLSMHLYEPNALGREFATICSIELPNRISVRGSTYVNVEPQIEIADISPSPLVIRPDEVGASSAGVDILPAQVPKLSVQLINHRDQPFKGEIVYGQENRPGFTHSQIELLAHQSKTVALSMPNPGKNTAANTRGSAPAGTLWFAVRKAGSIENIMERRIPMVRANAHVAPNLRVGYISGFDYSLPNALSALGVESKELSVDEVKASNLQRFSTIIVDNRVYESQPELIAMNQKLLDYANAGGTLIVFYHKSDEWNPDPRRNRPQLAPYKLLLGNERITDENAPITFLEPDHPLLNVPNKLNQDDFKDWIQERGLYYPREWDPQFHALLQSNDPGEAQLKGGLLVADYGRGHYIYSSMVWYRQLRAGVPGAYRMFANMISYGR